MDGDGDIVSASPLDDTIAGMKMEVMMIQHLQLVTEGIKIDIADLDGGEDIFLANDDTIYENDGSR